MNAKTELAKSDDKLELAAIKEDLGKFLETKGGRIWVRNLVKQCGVMTSGIFTGNSTTFYSLGKHDVGIGILKNVQEANPDAYASIVEGIQL
jgi:hypothetical protein